MFAAMKNSPTMKAGILELVEKGVSLTRAASCVKVHRSTVSEWVKKDGDFAAAVEQAESRFIERMIGTIADAAPSDWRAGIELLKRRFPLEFSAVRKVEVTNPQDEQQKRDEEIRTSLGYRRAILREAKALGFLPDSVDTEIVDEPDRPGANGKSPWGRQEAGSQP